MLRIAVVLCWLAMAPLAHAGVEEGDRAPELVGIKTAKGGKLRLAAYRGKVVVITFGASWCKPCKKELPALQKVARDFNQRKAAVAFIAINTDEEEATGRAFMAELGLTCLTIGYDPQQQSVGTYDPDPQPSTYVIDKNGIVRHVQPGYHGGDEGHIARKVAELLR